MPRRKQIVITPSNLGETLKKLREEQGLLQAQVSEKMGVHEQSVRRIEHDCANMPSFDKVFKYAELLGYKVALV